MTRHDLAGRLTLLGWLTIMWLMLWGEVTAPNVLVGLVLAAVLVFAIPPPELRGDPFYVHPWPALRFLVWFGWALVVSNVTVAREALAPAASSGINPAIVACRLRTRSGRLATVIANAITLTPGTLTVDARGRPAVLYVHVMSFDDAESARADVDDLERRVVDAFGSPEERAAICGRPLPPSGGSRSSSAAGSADEAPEVTS